MHVVQGQCETFADAASPRCSLNGWGSGYGELQLKDKLSHIKQTRPHTPKRRRLSEIRMTPPSVLGVVSSLLCPVGVQGGKTAEGQHTRVET